MATLLQCIDEFIDNITVTDRQEDNIKGSVNNLTDSLKAKDGGLFVTEVFVNGSYERDTIIRPLDDIDLFAVLDIEKYKDENGNMPNPQSVLSKIKNYLDGLNDYKGKVFQDRPCISVELSNKKFDIIPSFVWNGDTYWIPKQDLSGWDLTNPVTHTKNLDEINSRRKYLVKKVVKAVKKWKRNEGVNYPSYHVEESAMSIFGFNEITNIRDGIEKWFLNASSSSYTNSSKFKSQDEYDKAIKKIKKVSDEFVKAAGKKDEEAIGVWKEIFGSDFPVVTTEEAKNFSKSLTEGTLKVGAAGIVNTTVGKAVPASKGFFGEE